MSDELPTILNDLATGRIDAAEASRRIDALQGSTATSSQPGAAAPASDQADPETGRRQYAPHAREVFDRPHSDPEHSGPETSAASEPEPEPEVNVVVEDLPDDAPTQSARPRGVKGADRIVVRATGRRVRVEGDTSVATLSASGPHTLRRAGRVLEVTSEGELGPSLDGFSIIKPPRSLDDLRTLGLGKELVLRVNPDIPVDVEVTAGSLTTHQVPMLGKIRVTAGSATLEDVVEVEDALVQAGSASVTGPISKGRSRVRVESGQLGIHIARGGNVTIRGEAQMGRVSWPGGVGQVDEYLVGNGNARLDIGVVMGYASVKVDDHDDEEEQQ